MGAGPTRLSRRPRSLTPAWAVGVLFFVAAIFATLTSCISVWQSIVANCKGPTGPKKDRAGALGVHPAASAVIALGYSIFYFEVQLPNGSTGQLLDIMDYVSNSCYDAPRIAWLSTILLSVWVVGPGNNDVWVYRYGEARAPASPAKR